MQEMAALKADIERGLADVAAGRVEEFNSARVIERGRKLLGGPENSHTTGFGE
jgi:antitoxin ParD1/3/4